MSEKAKTPSFTFKNYSQCPMKSQNPIISQIPKSKVQNHPWSILIKYKPPPQLDIFFFWFIIAFMFILFLWMRWIVCSFINLALIQQIEDKIASQKDIDDWLPITSARNAKWYYSAFHNVTAMVGAGVLSLPYAMSELGW